MEAMQHKEVKFHWEWHFRQLFTIFWHGVDLLEEMKRHIMMDVIALYFRRKVRLSDMCEQTSTKDKFVNGMIFPKYTTAINMDFTGGYRAMLEQMNAHVSRCTMRKIDVKYLLVHYSTRIISDEVDWCALLSRVPMEPILNLTIVWAPESSVCVLPFSSTILQLYNRQ